LRALVAIVLSALLGTCSSPPPLLDRILRSGELTVVTRNTPAAFYYGADEPRGIEYELARGFAARLGVRLKLVTADEFHEVFPDVAEGRAHIGAAGLTINAARRERVEFGPAYQTVQPQLIYRMGTPRPKSIGELNGARLEVLAGSSNVALLENARRRVPYLQWVERRAMSAEPLIRSVARGETDYAIVNSNEFSLLRNYYPEAQVAFDLGETREIGWALPKGAADLREAVDGYFAELKSTGELERILDRYYYGSRNFDFVGSRAFVRHLNSREPTKSKLREP